ncbi:MAG: LamG-like jellyroll fold domain-containing protein [Isosphaeraceae bacterium]
MIRLIFVSLALICLMITPQLTQAETAAEVAARLGLPESAGKSLSFAATFDRGFEADFARGEARLFSSKTLERKVIDDKLEAEEVVTVTGGLGPGRMLQFRPGRKNFLFYKVKDNVAFRADGAWSGTFSYWLKLDPEQDLPKDFVDPLQITQKAWNDAAFWNDFTKDDRPRKFRLGVLADLKVWNPENRDFDKMPDAEKPAVVLQKTPFSREKWTNITISFSNFNSGEKNGRARLYLDGQLQGEVSGRNQRYSWEPDKAAILLGINYVGGFDNLLIFDRELTAEEIKAIAAGK